MAKPFPYGPFVGNDSPIIQKAQFENCMGAKAPECTDRELRPDRDRPLQGYRVQGQRYRSVRHANEKYREEGKPHFSKVLFKGGGDAASAARSVLETGEFDYAWNLQVEPEILTRMEAAGKGTVIAAFGPSVERLMVNKTNPDPALGDERGTMKHPAPVPDRPGTWSPALSLAIDRSRSWSKPAMALRVKSPATFCPPPMPMRRPTTTGARPRTSQPPTRLLDDAGWADTDGDGVRDKDGVQAVDPVPDLDQLGPSGHPGADQADVAEIGVEVELKNISASVFFGGDQSSPDTFQKFFADIEMYTNNFNGTDPEKYMASWTCAKIPSPENQWMANNMPRYCSEEYDSLASKSTRPRPNRKNVRRSLPKR